MGNIKLWNKNVTDYIYDMGTADDEAEIQNNTQKDSAFTIGKIPL